MSDHENWRDPSDEWWEAAVRYENFKATRIAIDRAELLDLLMSSFVPASEWNNRDSSGAMAQIGELYAYIVAGCAYRAFNDGGGTIWVHVAVPGFMWFEDGELSHEFGYVPTWERLEAVGEGKDWY